MSLIRKGGSARKHHDRQGTRTPRFLSFRPKNPARHCYFASGSLLQFCKWHVRLRKSRVGDFSASFTISDETPDRVTRCEPDCAIVGRMQRTFGKVPGSTSRTKRTAVRRRDPVRPPAEAGTGNQNALWHATAFAILLLISAYALLEWHGAVLPNGNIGAVGMITAALALHQLAKALGWTSTTTGTGDSSSNDGDWFGISDSDCSSDGDGGGGGGSAGDGGD